MAAAPDVGTLPDCPGTLWDAKFDDLKDAQQQAKIGSLPECPLEWTADADANLAGPEYFKANSEEIMSRLQEHGCIWFRGFDLMKSQEGFRSFYDSIGLPLCLDPIHTSGLRKMLSQKDGIYEEVRAVPAAMVHVFYRSKCLQNAFLAFLVCQASHP
jgi:hypothetical protein